jgi:hypothetical protein
MHSSTVFSEQSQGIPRRMVVRDERSVPTLIDQLHSDAAMSGSGSSAVFRFRTVSWLM